MSCKRTAGIKCKKVIVVIVAIAAVLGFLAIWVPGLPGPYHGAYLARGTLFNIYGGLRAYDEANGHLPPATDIGTENNQPLSWRIEIYHWSIFSPKTNDSIDYDRQKEWNDAENLRLESRGAWLFRYTQIDACPPGKRMGKAGVYTTYYKAVTGPATAFDSSSPHNLKQLPRNLIVVVRVEESDTHWMKPGDLNIEQLTSSEETKRLLLGKDGYVVLFADGEGWVLSGKTPIEALCKFFTITDAEQHDREQILGPYRVLP